MSKFNTNTEIDSLTFALALFIAIVFFLNIFCTSKPCCTLYRFDTVQVGKVSRTEHGTVAIGHGNCRVMFDNEKEKDFLVVDTKAQITTKNITIKKTIFWLEEK